MRRYTIYACATFVASFAGCGRHHHTNGFTRDAGAEAGVAAPDDSSDSGAVPDDASTSEMHVRSRPRPVSCSGRPSAFAPRDQQFYDASKSCASYLDCTEGVGGRCTRFYPSAPSMQCVYNECYADSDCATGQVCECGGELAGAYWNRCVGGGCTIDSDCGLGRRCGAAPNEDCGPRFPLNGYYCIGTDADECTSDVTCGPGGYCTFSRARDRWVCGPGPCAGSGAAR